MTATRTTRTRTTRTDHITRWPDRAANPDRMLPARTGPEPKEAGREPLAARRWAAVEPRRPPAESVILRSLRSLGPRALMPLLPSSRPRFARRSSVQRRAARGRRAQGPAYLAR